MKALFIAVLLVCSSAAFANNGNNGPSPAENNTSGAKENKTVKQVKNVRTEDANEKKQTTATKRTSRVCNTNDVETPGYGIGSYFVEFVHRNNIRLVKLLAD